MPNALARPTFVALLLGLAALTGAARAEEAEPEVILPATIVDGESRSDAENAELAARAEEAHAEWLKFLAEHPENKLLAKAEKSGAFAEHPEKMRCWVSGFSAVIGAQTGVCKSAGRKFAFSALAFGASAEIHTGRLKLVADRPFPDSLNLTGGRGSGYFLIGFEALDLGNAKAGVTAKGRGFGLGFGAAAEFIWVSLTRL